VDKRVATAVMMAAQHHNADIVRVLAEHGADGRELNSSTSRLSVSTI